MGEKIITGNYFNKYNTKNPIYRKLMNNFSSHFIEIIKSQQLPSLNILETGCGEGHLANILISELDNVTYQGFDIDNEIVQIALANSKDKNIEVGSIYDLSKYQDQEFNFVITSEVMEHLERPEEALTELQKLKAKYFLLSVPNEPIWRILNLIRLNYVRDLGNTPGHIQHWSKSSFKHLLSNYFEVIEFRGVFPWSMALCKKK